MMQITSKTTSTPGASIVPLPSNVVSTNYSDFNPSESLNKIQNEFALQASDSLQFFYDTEFNAIKQRYGLVNEEDIKNYLLSNKYLYSLLIKGMDIIKEEINRSIESILLELYTFVDDGNKSLFITIKLNDIENDSDDIEDRIINKITSLPSKPLDGKIVVSVLYNELS